MNRSRSRWAAGLSAAAALLASVASAAGVFLRGNLATRSYVSVRGETVDVLVGGIYRYNAKSIAAEGVGWDAVTLFLVVPILAATLPGIARGRLRPTLLATGLLAYLLYQYLEYAMYLAYGPMFLVYVATFALSLSAIAVVVGGLDLAGLPKHFSRKFPRRSVISLGVFMAVLLCGMWLPLVARTARGDVAGHLFGATTLVVQGLDLGLLVPLGLFTALAVQRRAPVGYLLSSVVVVKAVAMATAICAMLGFEYHATGVLPVGSLAIFAGTAVGSAVLAARVYGSIDEPASPGRAPAFASGTPTAATIE